MKIINRVLFFAGLIVLWQIIASIGIWPQYKVPSFSSSIIALYQGIIDTSIIKGILVSLQRLFIGYSISIALGIPIGFLLGKYKYLEDTVGSLALGLQTIPSIAWLPFAIIWLGLNESAVVFVVIMGSLFSITISTLSGLKNLEPIYIQAAQTMGAKGLKLNRHVVFPAILPSIIQGLKQGWAFAWRSLMAGELIVSSGGLGYLMNVGREFSDINQMVAIMLILITLGLVFERLVFSRIESLITKRWGLNLSNR